jgi:hypothetical protein
VNFKCYYNKGQGDDGNYLIVNPLMNVFCAFCAGKYHESVWTSNSGHNLDDKSRWYFMEDLLEYDE